MPLESELRPQSTAKIEMIRRPLLSSQAENRSTRSWVFSGLSQ